MGCNVTFQYAIMIKIGCLEELSLDIYHFFWLKNPVFGDFEICSNLLI